MLEKMRNVCPCEWEQPLVVQGGFLVLEPQFRHQNTQNKTECTECTGKGLETLPRGGFLTERVPPPCRLLAARAPGVEVLHAAGARLLTVPASAFGEQLV